MNLARHCLLPLLLLVAVVVSVHARPHRRSAVDYFGMFYRLLIVVAVFINVLCIVSENNPYGESDGIAIDFVTIPPTASTAEPKKPAGDVRTNRINSFMSTLSQLNDSSTVVQWLRSMW